MAQYEVSATQNTLTSSNHRSLVFPLRLNPQQQANSQMGDCISIMMDGITFEISFQLITNDSWILFLNNQNATNISGALFHVRNIMEQSQQI